jgi:hypothetical protein
MICRKSSVVNEPSKPQKDAKTEFEKLKNLKDEQIISILNASYPAFDIQAISSSWRYDHKQKLIAEGVNANIIISNSGK